MVLRRVKDRCRLKFNVAIAEVGDQDAWQSAQVGFAVVANDKQFVESQVTKIISFIDSLAVAKLAGEEKDFLTYGDECLSDGSDFVHWEPGRGT